MILHEEKLSSEKHFKSVGDFFCGADSPLDTFLSCNAFKYDEQKYGITYVLTESEASSEILGFYTYILPKVKAVAEYVAVKAIIAFVEPEDEQAIGFYKSIGFEKASDLVQREIAESFNEECDLYMVSLDEV